jgi:hypothetical protein
MFSYEVGVVRVENSRFLYGVPEIPHEITQASPYYVLGTAGPLMKPYNTQTQGVSFLKEQGKLDILPYAIPSKFLL